MKTLVLGLGNDLISDDAVGPLAARRLRDEGGLPPDVDVVETALHGVALLELFIGYDRAIILDAVHTSTLTQAPAQEQAGAQPRVSHALHPAGPGSIHELDPSDFDAVANPSPHFTGLPELFALADRLELEFPHQIKIFAVEVADTTTIGGPLTPAVEAALPALCHRVREQLRVWSRPNE